jgi:hypothetical protein
MPDILLSVPYRAYSLDDIFRYKARIPFHQNNPYLPAFEIKNRQSLLRIRHNISSISS